MKYKINFTTLIVLITFFNLTSFSQNQKIEQSIVDLIKENNFNLEIYELSVCINELFYIIETDSSKFLDFEIKMEKSFDKSLSLATKNIHSIEFKNFKKQIINNDSLQIKFPHAYMKISNYQIKYIPNKLDYLNSFKNYIDYPEQVDDICIITLLYNSNSSTLDSILNDKIAFWRFSNWIDYGFEEFRYYPNLSNKGKEIITNRLILYIKKINKNNNHYLVQKSLESINSSIAKYKKRK